MKCFTTWQRNDKITFDYYKNGWKTYTGVFVRWENIQYTAVFRIGGKEYKFKRSLMSSPQ